MKKLVLGILIAIPVILGAILLYVYLNLNTLVVEAVETFAPRVTGTKVSLASSSVSVFSGQGSLQNLVISNPKGYKAPSAFELGSLAVALDTESLTTETIVIKSIDIVAPTITYEPGGPAGSNLQQIIKNVQASGKKGQTGAQSEKKEGAGAKVVIDRVTVNQGKVNLYLATPLTDERLSADLPKIELTGIGRKQGGVSAERALTLVMDKILASATKVGAGSLTEAKARLRGEVNKQIDELKSKTGGVPKDLEGEAGELGEKFQGLLR